MKNKGIYLKFFVLGIIALAMIVPFIYSLYTSLLQKSDLDTLVPIGRLTFESYIYIYENSKVLLWYRNTVIVTAITIAGNAFINSLAGYSLARIKYPGKGIVFLLIIAPMMIPFQIALIPLYMMMLRLGWLNTIYALTIPFLCSGFLAFLMRQFYLSIPVELEESAKIDGLNRWQIFTRVIMPLSKVAFATMIIFNFTGTWNSFMIPVLFTTDVKKFVLTVGLNTLKSEHFEWPNITMAGIILVLAPVIIVFVIFQKNFTESIAASGIKG